MRLVLTTGFQAISGRIGSVTQGMVGMPRKSPGSAEYTAFARSGFNPTNPQSSQQIAIRALLSASSAAYKSLTVAEADAWEALGIQISVDGPVGSTHGLTGIQAYNRVNLFRQLDGQAITDTAPAFEDPGNASAVDAEISTGDPTITVINITHTVTGGFFAVRVTPALPSIPRKARKNELRYMSSDFIDSIVPLGASPQAVSLDHGQFSQAQGDNIGIEVIHLNADYVPSKPLFDRRNVIATVA